MILSTILFIISLATSISVNPNQQSTSESETAKRIKNLLEKFPVIDGHNDLAWNLRGYLFNDLREFNFTDLKDIEPWKNSAYSQTDLNRLKVGRVGGQFWAAYLPCSSYVKDAVPMVLEQIDVIHRLVKMYPEDLHYAESSQDIEKAMAEGKIASLIGVEGGHMIQFSLGILRQLYKMGTRYLTLTHNCNIAWADSGMVDVEEGTGTADTPWHRGLSKFGITIIHEMNRLGMMIDLSHASLATQLDSINNSDAPVIFSHSNAYGVYKHHRNVRDDVLELIKKKDGLIMVNFYKPFLVENDRESTIEDVANHLDYLKKKLGAEHIGIGSDFDGMDMPAKGLEDVSKYPDLFVILAERGWTDDEIAKCSNKNLLRVFKLVEKVRDSKKDLLPLEGRLVNEDLAKFNISLRCLSNQNTMAAGEEYI